MQLTPGQNFRYLDSADTQKLLEQGWGNPDGSGTLGMLIPDKVNPLSAEGWGIILEYSNDGYISDKEASTINYQKLLRQMQDQAESNNSERKKQGYEAVHLKGWAAEPRYDASSHKLYWAKDLQFGDTSEHTLNYNIRVLGRKGVLNMNVVAGMNQLAMVQQSTPSILQTVNFTRGNRYEDYVAGQDKLADYGIAALIAGGAAATAVKTGLLAKLLLLLVGLKKFAVLIVVAIAGFFRRLVSPKNPYQSGE